MLRRRRDDGFTLVELLLSISVLGIVMLGLVAVLLGSMATNTKSKLRINETRDQQFIAAYFSTDAQAAGTILTAVPATCGSGTAAVEFRGSSYDPSSSTSTGFALTSTVVSYVFSTASVDGEDAGQLRRQSCETGKAVASTTLARNLATAMPLSTCLPSRCTPTSKSTSVTMNLVRRGVGAPFSVVGTRRTSP